MVVRQFKGAHIVQNASDLPNIHLSAPSYLVKLLRCVHLGIVWVVPDLFIIRAEGSRILAVAYLHCSILRKENLLRNQTAVNQPLILQVLDGKQYLNEDFPLLVGGQCLTFLL